MAINDPRFYLVIIGTEILNGRREDAHFDFIKNELLSRGWELTASFIITDTPSLIEDVFNLVKKDPKGVMFSFGGIGATPDDFTREVAAKVFRNSQIIQNKKAKELIIEEFKEKAFPHRIKMANLPINCDLLLNPVNNVPGFFLDERYFFVPGFIKMSHPMIKYALDKFYPKAPKKYRFTICVEASENDLLDIMKKIPKSVEFSSLPSIENKKYKDVISIASNSIDEAKRWIDFFKKEVEKRGFKYQMDKECI